MPLGPNVTYTEVSTVLWEERDLLDGLAFTLEMQRLILLPGHDRWVPRVCREVELSLSRLAPIQLARAGQVERLGRQLGLEPSPSLRRIVEVSEAPWQEIFASHRRAFLDLTAEIVGLAEHNRMWLGRSRAAFLAASGWLVAGASNDPEHPEDPSVFLAGDEP